MSSTPPQQKGLSKVMCRSLAAWPVSLGSVTSLGTGIDVVAVGVAVAATVGVAVAVGAGVVRVGVGVCSGGQTTYAMKFCSELLFGFGSEGLPAAGVCEALIVAKKFSPSGPTPGPPHVSVMFLVIVTGWPV